MNVPSIDELQVDLDEWIDSVHFEGDDQAKLAKTIAKYQKEQDLCSIE